MIFNILDNTTELWMTKYIIGEIFSSGGATLYKKLDFFRVLSHCVRDSVFLATIKMKTPSASTQKKYYKRSTFGSPPVVRRFSSVVN